LNFDSCSPNEKANELWIDPASVRSWFQSLMKRADVEKLGAENNISVSSLIPITATILF
jgi:hypothetical protein